MFEELTINESSFKAFISEEQLEQDAGVDLDKLKARVNEVQWIGPVIVSRALAMLVFKYTFVKGVDDNTVSIAKDVSLLTGVLPLYGGGKYQKGKQIMYAPGIKS